MNIEAATTLAIEIAGLTFMFVLVFSLVALGVGLMALLGWAIGYSNVTIRHKIAESMANRRRHCPGEFPASKRAGRMETPTTGSAGPNDEVPRWLRKMSS
jgi:hypothetical protein